METVSLILIAIGLVIIAVVVIARLRIKREQNAMNDSFHRPYDDKPHDEQQDYDPLFAIDNAEAERRELDKLSSILATPDEPKISTPPQANTAPAAAPTRERAVTPPRETAAPAPQTPAPPRVARKPPRVAGAAEQVVTLNVMAHEGQRFAGPDIAQAMERAGMEWGTWSIYHYYSRQAPQEPPLFSAANMVKPGNFDPAHLEDMSTVGLSLFMVPAMDGTDMASFDMLLSTARQLASDLGGEVRDARRSLLTRQSTERMREELIEWRRKAQLAHS